MVFPGPPRAPRSRSRGARRRRELGRTRTQTGRGREGALRESGSGRVGDEVRREGEGKAEGEKRTTGKTTLLSTSSIRGKQRRSLLWT
jgi:hypothetical protein